MEGKQNVEIVRCLGQDEVYFISMFYWKIALFYNAHLVGSKGQCSLDQRLACKHLSDINMVSSVPHVFSPSSTQHYYLQIVLYTISKLPKLQILHEFLKPARKHCWRISIYDIQNQYMPTLLIFYLWTSWYIEHLVQTLPSRWNLISLVMP